MVFRRVVTASSLGCSAALASNTTTSCWQGAAPLSQWRGQRQAAQKDLYTVLGVTRGAKEGEIKKAYLGKAKKLHPDVNPSPKAAEEFSEVKKAYEVLSDPQKKSMYDMTGNAGAADGMAGGQGPGGFNPFAGMNGGQNPFANMGGNGGQNPFANMGQNGGKDGNPSMSFTDFEDMFSRMSGAKGQEKARKPQGPEPGADIHFKLKLSFLEAVNGVSKEISYNTVRKCTACTGSGAKDNQEKAKCPHCNGRGKKVMATGFFHMQQDCTHCNGTGETSKSTCTQCTGKGVIKDRAVQTLPVPKGVDNRERLKITGKGEAGLRNGPPGNLFVEITVDDHAIFHRDGVDIHMVAPITLSQAVLGGPIRIPTLVGEVETKVPAGTQQGDKVVIRGRGVHRPTQQKTGDFYIHFAVMLPKELTERQKAAVAEFAKDEEQTKLTDAQLQELKGRYKSWFTA
jgi:molecular chaperone DnaJ